jgi:hypothetical protein
MLFYNLRNDGIHESQLRFTKSAATQNIFVDGAFPDRPTAEYLLQKENKKSPYFSFHWQVKTIPFNFAPFRH